MKPATTILGLFILIILTVSASYAQQQFTQTVTSGTNGNRSCNDACSVLDFSGNTDPKLIIFITPIAPNYPHPIGAYFMWQSKWSVFNLDGSPMVTGTQFKVEYYNPDTNHFVYVAPPLAHSNDVRFIDHAGLNDYSNAQIRVFPTNSPPNGVHGANFNPTEVRTAFDLTTSKWFIYNMNSAPVPAGTAYNIMFSNGGPVITNPNGERTLNTDPKTPTSPIQTINNPNSGKELNPKTPATPITNTTAGGDLNGNYPNPNVIGLQGRPLSNVQPTVGQILKWGLNGWEPGDNNAGNSNPPTMPKSYSSFLTGEFIWVPGDSEIELAGMSVQFTITQPSMVNVSVIAETKVTTNCGLANNCDGFGTGIILYRNGTQLFETEKRSNNDESITLIVPNYPELLNPGTYTYKVYGTRVSSHQYTVKYFGNSSRFKSYITVQIFPQ